MRSFDPSKPALAKDASVAATYTARGGTIRYMAPEQFVTGQSSVQSDVWALGVILYELVSGRHPFARPDAEDFQAIRAIQFSDPPDLSEIVPGISPELKSVIATCLEKNPGAALCFGGRSARGAEDHHEGAADRDRQHSRRRCGESAHHRRLKLRSGRRVFSPCWRSAFANRRPIAPQQNSLVVLPFTNLGAKEVAPLYGFALADAIAARLARIPALVVRPSSTLMSLPMAQMDPLSVGQRLLVSYVLTGSFLRSEQGFDLNWQLLDVESQTRAFRRRHPGGLARPDCGADGNFQ